MASGMEKFAAVTDSALTEQTYRLKNYVERGDPAPALPKPSGSRTGSSDTV
jgi:hypothetical protein